MSTTSVKPDTVIQIFSASSINAKVTRCLEALGFEKDGQLVSTARNAEISTDGKPQVVAIEARAPVSGKAVSIAEIVKRRIEEHGSTWFQYTALSSVFVEKKERKRKRGHGPEDGQGRKKSKTDEDVSDEDNDKEETGGTEAEEDDPYRPLPTKEEVPVITIYLSRSEIKELAEELGEQTNRAETVAKKRQKPKKPQQRKTDVTVHNNGAANLIKTKAKRKKNKDPGNKKS